MLWYEVHKTMVVVSNVCFRRWSCTRLFGLCWAAESHGVASGAAFRGMRVICSMSVKHRRSCLLVPCDGGPPLGVGLL